LSVLNYTTDEMTSVITAIAARNRFDLVHLDSCHMVEYVPLIETLWQSRRARSTTGTISNPS